MMINKSEIILRKLSNIGVNNKILELEDALNLQKDNNKASYEKTKKLFSELIERNKVLMQKNQELEKNIISLQTELNYNKSIINRIPKFILHFFTKNRNKLLNKGNIENE